jgi:hypothetical protein
MTSKADYTEEEWVRLRRAPFVAGLAISIADPGGPIEMAKETIARQPPSSDGYAVGPQELPTSSDPPCQAFYQGTRASARDRPWAPPERPSSSRRSRCR